MLGSLRGHNATSAIIDNSSSLIGRKVNQDDMDIQGFGENVAELLTSGSAFFLFLDQCAAEN